MQYECHHYHQPTRAKVDCVPSSCLPFDIDYGAIPLGRAPLVAAGEEEENYALLNTKTMLEIVRLIFFIWGRFFVDGVCGPFRSSFMIWFDLYLAQVLLPCYPTTTLPST